MPKATTDKPATKLRRVEALERILRLQLWVSAHNRDLTAEQAEDVAEELSQAAIKRLNDRGEISFERDHPGNAHRTQ
jgi:hypothetical protein